MTIDDLKQAFSYDPETGLVTRRIAVSQFTIGTVAGSVNAAGYVDIVFRGKRLRGHRVAFALMTGAWPSNILDHVNGDRADNRWKNLRECSQSDNAKNRTVNTKGRSGVRGVRYNGKSSKTRPWEVLIKHNYKQIYIGRYATKEEAIAARYAASAKYHGDFAGRIESTTEANHG